MMQRQQQRLIEILQNPDLDPITTLDQPIQTTVDEVDIPEQTSLASSVTFETTDNPNDASSQATKIRNNTQASESVGSIGTKTMRDMIDPNLSLEENRKRIASSTALRINRLQQRQAALDLELKQQQQKQQESTSIDMDDMENIVSHSVPNEEIGKLKLANSEVPASAETGKAP